MECWLLADICEQWKADKFNLIKLNNGTNGTNVNTKTSYNVDDDSAEEQDKIAQLREANKALQEKVHMYEDVPSCKLNEFTVSGKMKPSKSRQKLKAHREKHQF